MHPEGLSKGELTNMSEKDVKMMIKVKVVKVMIKAMQMVKVVAPGVKLMTRSLLSRSTWLRSLEPS